ncbi:MAG: DUF6029 family protein [Bacteroidetes bacterium]|nr:DUF6029 family protein [Bacteroidota bacterium]
MKRYLFLLLLIPFISNAQDVGTLSGDLQLAASAYQYNAKIGTGTTQYLHELSSAEDWLQLNYRYKDLTIIVRHDLYHNSPLLNPSEAYTGQGLGYYSASKDFGKLNVTVGSFYDQFGSGIIFRSFEERAIGQDYAMNGVRLKFTPNDSFMIKAFTGLEKNRFGYHPRVIKGINTEKIWGIGKYLSFVTGAGLVNRTLDQTTIDQLASRINALELKDRFIPSYNVFAYSFYNTLRVGEFSLYTEYAGKTKEAIYYETSFSQFDLKNKDGKVIYGVLNYSHPGIGVNLQYKKTESFILRTSPDDKFLVGAISFLPPLSKQHAFRLPARYGISARDQGEEAVQAEVTYSPFDHHTINLNFAKITMPDRKELLYKEYSGDYTVKMSRRVRSIIGLQYLEYNQERYQAKADAKLVKALTPYTEWSIKIDKGLRKSIRVEGQYMFTKQDLGNFAFGLVEFNWAPHYSFSVSDMVNTKDTKNMVHYYSIFGAYSYNQTRVTLGYVKQVEGVVCTGGVCRVEPAFIGVKFGLSTNF